MREITPAEIKRFSLQFRRPTSLMLVVDGQLPEEASVSSFGRVNLGAKGEAWPEHEGVPMVPLCQINLREAPYLPAQLRDIEFITIFLSLTAMYESPMGSNGSGWCLRAYSELDELQELAQPAIDTTIIPRPIIWEKIETDFPSWDEFSPDMTPETKDAYADVPELEGYPDSKVGGWAWLPQSEPSWAEKVEKFEYVLQIATEEKANWEWGDSGVAHFGRSKTDPRKWAFDWQCF